ncbi:MAG: alkaline phosphatase family protein [Saprospiraceae bacterium]|nr:alkaline phosphatase family protein [Saprospiraceae bacterium]
MVLKMLRGIILCGFILVHTGAIRAQIISGPMLGYVEHRTAKIWLETKPGSDVQLWFWPSDQTKQRNRAYRTTHSRLGFETLTFDLVGLEPGLKYEYEILDQKKKPIPGGSGIFNTQILWKWRVPAPDFSFLAGSCYYANETAYDRPGKPYGAESNIFQSMANEDSYFLLWLGDNYYTREADYYSEWGLWDRASHSRANPKLQPLLKKMGHVGIWDDHDFGPNNSGISFSFREHSRQVFKNYFPNPTAGYKDEGIYTQLSYYDLDFFLLDNRYWRSSDSMQDSIDGKPNPDKKMLGKQQMEWLKNGLLNSYQPFKLIVNGSQSLNQNSNNDCWMHFPAEINELLEFIKFNDIRGVIFLSGDKHNSEVIKLDRENNYPLYELTLSALTSGPHKLNDLERANPQRVQQILFEENNYGRISISGPAKNRMLKLEIKDVSGKTQKEWSVSETELSHK